MPWQKEALTIFLLIYVPQEQSVWSSRSFEEGFCLWNFKNHIMLHITTIHLRRQQFFTIFDPYPPTLGSFLLLSVGKFGTFLIPPPLRNADVLNGWSHMYLYSWWPKAVFDDKCPGPTACANSPVTLTVEDPIIKMEGLVKWPITNWPMVLSLLLLQAFLDLRC